ncbi:uncharacterized protein K460DRAFT_421161 [Cucurbitaria berberidis CBS 394.84]|uniref:Uncharacterized protein n=1 Tax=Cucurbitaria berberidis CBS 394.84 TaxID=1168544 RepID=A0A9P4G6X8_9PLEO|nr:uncharacterized protein K460DRAFT_421161 [Cucurbitaria berberidis CBS 394.84]KAF1840168.1 hypothetical protein K460DRAFT_421161 [Cucurbitaria berberidis CBS 394.84]
MDSFKMGIAKYFHRATPATSHRATTAPSPLGIWPLFASNAILSALSIITLALISSTVAWLLEQKHNVHSYEIAWPATSFQLNVLPKNVWGDQGYESNGAAGYGFLVGIFGMITAWRLRRAGRPLKSLTVLLVLQIGAILFTLSAFIFVFIVTYKTMGQYIREPIAANNVGTDYAEYKWTPETWMKAVLDLPLADQGKRDQINTRVTNMVAWRWMLLPLFIVDCLAFSVTVAAWLRLRKCTTTRSSSADAIEK